MELLQLRYFYESAKNESFAKTAEKYMVPATSVSASVKRLEKELGCELFHRLSNRISLSHDGEKFKQSVELALGELDRATNSISTAMNDTREIKILVRAMRSEITDCIIEYKEKHPHVIFKTVFDFTEPDFEKYDIIIDAKCDRYKNYEKIDLYNTQIRFQVSANYPLGDKTLTLKQLKNHSFIIIGENSSLHQILLTACKSAGFTPDIAVQSNDLSCLLKCVQAGVGIGFKREYPKMVKRENLRTLDVSDFNVKQTICCYYKKHSDYGNIKHFLSFLINKAI